MINTEHFYASLKPVKNFMDLASLEAYVPLPDNWYIIVTDIVASTQAIRAGRYKDVNLLGASSIIAVLNVAGPIEIPFVFGGDGASLVVPPSLLQPARDAVLSVQKLAQEAFALELRVGVVPVEDVQHSHPIRVAKFQDTTNYCQASFLGGGITSATNLIKTSPLYQLQCGPHHPAANLTGLECRWQDIPSLHGHTLSLIVQALPSSQQVNDAVYSQVLAQIQTIYGDCKDYHPIAPGALKLAFGYRQLSSEIKARTASSGCHERWLYFLRIVTENLLGWIFMRFGLTAGEVAWDKYKQELVNASDYQKIDDSLRMVISGTPEQTQQLLQFLEHHSWAGSLSYGLHVSDRALVTCMIFNRSNCHIHLIDGADGGYALAAQNLKERLHRKVQNWSAYTKLLPIRQSTSMN